MEFRRRNGKKTLLKEEGDKTETSRKHRQLAVKWAFGRFPPISSSLLEGKVGEVVHEHMHNITENLKKYNLSGEKMQAAEASLEQILFLTASFFEDMEQEEMCVPTKNVEN